jgi:integrative and conjugative element protein (TIGR02256 family)
MPGVRDCELILSTTGGRYVLVHDRVVEKMAAWLDPQEGFKEAGGIFIGSYRGPHLELIDCTTPLPSDIRRRTLFDRRDPGHQAAAFSAWKRSKGTETFVGEWHTHPEKVPQYSGTDWQTWSRLMRRTEDPLVFAIAGWSDWWWSVGLRGSLTEVHVEGQRVKNQ